MKNQKSTFTSILLAACAGITIGTTIELIFSFAQGGSYYSPGVPSFIAAFSSPHFAVLIERIIYAALGIASLISARIYDNEKYSLLFNTFRHISVMMLCVLLAGTYLHWWSSTPQELLGSLCVFFAVYALIWVCIYVRARRNMKILENEIKKRNVQRDALEK